MALSPLYHTSYMEVTVLNVKVTYAEGDDVCQETHCTQPLVPCVPSYGDFHCCLCDGTPGAAGCDTGVMHSCCEVLARD